MKKWMGKVSILCAICCAMMIGGGCDFLGFNDNELYDGNDDGGSSEATPTEVPEPGKPHRITPVSTDRPQSTPTPTPDNGHGADFVVSGAGDRMEFNLGAASSGTFHFEARGFDPNRYGGNTQQLKPVYFWLYNGLYDYNCPGLLFEVRQLLYAGYWCTGGKIKGRNGGSWRGEECYSHTWESDPWFSFDITWGGGRIVLNIDGIFSQSMSIGTISGTVIAGIGWPPARREGIIGLEYRNIGMK